jgi:hypothetical protein
MISKHNMATLASVSTTSPPPQAFVSKLKKKVKVFEPSKAEMRTSRRITGESDEGDRGCVKATQATQATNLSGYS